MPIFWQEFFESNLNLQKEGPGRMEDCYQYHALVQKTNRYFIQNRRFIVLSAMWMFNISAEFTDKKCKEISFKDSKWQQPVEALEQVVLTMDGKYLVLTVHFNKEKQKRIIAEAGLKKVDKTKRELKFKDMPAAQLFLFQLKRLHHLWNRADGKAETVPPLDVIDKAQFQLARQSTE